MADSVAVQKKALHLMIDALPAFQGTLKDALNDLSQYFSTDAEQRGQLIKAAMIQARKEIHGGA